MPLRRSFATTVVVSTIRAPSTVDAARGGFRDGNRNVWPLYVYGDLKRVQASSPTHVKVAGVADRVTFLSRGWHDANHPWNDAPTSTPTPPPTGQMIVGASIVSGMPLHGGDTHDMGCARRRASRTTTSSCAVI